MGRDVELATEMSDRSMAAEIALVQDVIFDRLPMQPRGVVHSGSLRVAKKKEQDEVAQGPRCGRTVNTHNHVQGPVQAGAVLKMCGDSPGVQNAWTGLHVAAE